MPEGQILVKAHVGIGGLAPGHTGYMNEGLARMAIAQGYVSDASTLLGRLSPKAKAVLGVAGPPSQEEIDALGAVSDSAKGLAGPPAVIDEDDPPTMAAKPRQPKGVTVKPAPQVEA